MLGIFIILLVWMDGRNLSSLMMKEEIKEKRPVSSKWLLFTVLGIVFIILAIKQYKPGTWGYYFAHIYFLIGGILIITFSGAFILEQAKKGPFYFRYALKINQLDSKYQSNILIILMLFVIHFFALSYIGTQIVEILPLDKTNSNYPYDIIWMARQNDEKYSEKIAEKYNGMFEDNPYFDVVKENPDGESAYHLYPILLKEKYANHKKEIFSKLRSEGLGVQVHYIPVYLQPYYQNLGFNKGLCPVDEEFYKRELSIPMYPTLTDEDLEFVQEKLYKVFSEY